MHVAPATSRRKWRRLYADRCCFCVELRTGVGLISSVMLGYAIYEIIFSSWALADDNTERYNVYLPDSAKGLLAFNLVHAMYAFW